METLALNTRACACLNGIKYVEYIGYHSKLQIKYPLPTIDDLAIFNPVLLFLL